MSAFWVLGQDITSPFQVCSISSLSKEWNKTKDYLVMMCSMFDVSSLNMVGGIWGLPLVVNRVALRTKVTNPLDKFIFFPTHFCPMRQFFPRPTTLLVKSIQNHELLQFWLRSNETPCSGHGLLWMWVRKLTVLFVDLLLSKGKTRDGSRGCLL